MENKKHIIHVIIIPIIIIAVFLGTPVSALSENKGNTFSFRFENCTVAEALREISEKSGIKIISNGAIKKEIYSKYYSNRSLESIITDLLRGEDCDLVWNYSKGNLHSINLYTPDENDVKRTVAGSNTTNRAKIDSNQYSSSENMDIDEVIALRDNYLKNRDVNSRNRSNTSFSTSRTPGVSRSTNPDSNRASDTSSVPANIRRAVINKQNNETKNETNEETGEEAVEVKNPEPSPESPVPPEQENHNVLERPPMPPGL